jgi:hypothetical protein
MGTYHRHNSGFVQVIVGTLAARTELCLASIGATIVAPPPVEIFLEPELDPAAKRILVISLLRKKPLQVLLLIRLHRVVSKGWGIMSLYPLLRPVIWISASVRCDLHRLECEHVRYWARSRVYLIVRRRPHIPKMLIWIPELLHVGARLRSQSLLSRVSLVMLLGPTMHILLGILCRQQDVLYPLSELQHILQLS